MNTKAHVGTVVVVAHDAGGAEVVSSYIRRENLSCIYVLQGAAVSVFNRKLGDIEIVPLEEAFNRADWLLCGTSWQSDLEYEAIKMAKEQRKYSVAFLDHWVNYRERFERKGELHIPDEIWVGDESAASMATRIFQDTSVRLVANPYFADIIGEINIAHEMHGNTSDNLKVLYVLEPIKEHALRRFGNEYHWGYGEEDALRYFLDNLVIFNQTVDEIVLRPHPSEKIEKYKWVQSEYKIPIFFGGQNSLADEIARSNVVVGCSSMAMVIGLLANKMVISSIPPEGCNYTLPQSEIIMLRDRLRSSVDESGTCHTVNGLI